MFSMVKNRVFPLRSETRQKCLILPLLFTIVLKVLATAIREGKSNPHWKRRKNSHRLQSRSVVSDSLQPRGL